MVMVTVQGEIDAGSFDSETSFQSADAHQVGTTQVDGLHGYRPTDCLRNITKKAHLLGIMLSCYSITISSAYP